MKANKSGGMKQGKDHSSSSSIVGAFRNSMEDLVSVILVVGK